jgi:hypothetical protein
MTLMKLTENRYVDGENIAEAEFHPDPEKPILEITYKKHETLSGFRLFGPEAEQAWQNFRLAVQAWGRGDGGDIDS